MFSCNMFPGILSDSRFLSAMIPHLVTFFFFFFFWQWPNEARVKHKKREGKVIEVLREGYFFMLRRLQNNFVYFFYKQPLYKQHQAEI